MLEGGAANYRACKSRAPSNGMEDPTLLLWRPVLVRGRTPLVVSDLCTKQIENLQCGATQPSGCERCVQSSLPCVEWVDLGAKRKRPRPGTFSDIPLKPSLQKRLRDGLTAVEIT